jgi:CubicO group peptidase (beta-lactamase class C family)
MGFLSCAQDVRPYDVRVKEALSEGLQEFNVRGASVAVILSDGKIHCVVAGYSHDSTVIEPEMLFAIGTIAKNVVAALALQLAEEGILAPDDPISRWLPAYSHVDGTITIRQLLNHTSGLYMTAEDLARWSDALFGGRVLRKASLDAMLNFGKGGYGLGVGYFRSTLAGDEQAVGHMGGNIGTTASMVYSRRYGVSVVVMVNAYHLKCISKRTEEVGKITLEYLASEER